MKSTGSGGGGLAYADPDPLAEGTLHPVEGHEAVRRTLTGAVRRGRLPGSLLLHGPAGIGKQRVALWLGQLLLCEAPAAEGPCERCRGCRLASRLEHPDLHWFFPLPRPKGASSPERLRDALEQARAEELAARRVRPLRYDATGGASGIYLAQIQSLRRLAASRPATGSVQVFVIGDAEAMVPQESSQEAANAFLKLLEEPPDSTYFVLTSSDPDGLLPTIRSRLASIRLTALAPEHAAAFLVRHCGAGPDGAAVAARVAEGSIGRALGFLGNGEVGPLEEHRLAARSLLESLASEDAGPRLAAAHRQSPAGSRGEFAVVLDLLGVWLRDVAAAANGAGDHIVNQDSLPLLERTAAALPGARSRVSTALALLDEAQELAGGNVNPQLISAWLLAALRNALADSPRGRPPRWKEGP